MAGRYDPRRPVVRRVRGPGLPDPPVLHLPRPRLRRPGHRSVSVAVGPGPRSLEAPGMNAFTYDALPGRVVFGVGSVERLPEEVERLGASRVLLVYDLAVKEV